MRTAVVGQTALLRYALSSEAQGLKPLIEVLRLALVWHVMLNAVKHLCDPMSFKTDGRLVGCTSSLQSKSRSCAML